MYGREYYEFAGSQSGDPPAQQDRTAFGNLMTVIERAASQDLYQLAQSNDKSVWGEIFPDISDFQIMAEDIITNFTYEPVYQQVLTVSDPGSRQISSGAIQARPCGASSSLLTRRIWSRLNMLTAGWNNSPVTILREGFSKGWTRWEELPHMRILGLTNRISARIPSGENY